MDVTCPRCQTDYEFDDALVSERGTTVKCTNCGHQFRVFRPRAASTTTAAPELWRIERRQGEALELRSLVELQRAIRAGRVSRDDLLRRGEGPSRRVGDIPELEPFFPAPRNEGAPNTLPLPVAEPLVAAPPRVPAHTPSYGKPASVPPPPPGAGGTARPPGLVAPLARNVDRIPPAPRLPTPLGLAPPPIEGGDRGRGPSVVEHRVPSAPPPVAAPPPRTPPPPMAPPIRHDHEAEPPTVRRTDTSRTSAVPPPRTTSAVASERPPVREESYDSLFPPPRKKSSKAGWIVALLVIGGLGAAAATVGRPYLQKLSGGAPAASSAPGSDRLTRELAAGDRARDDGDWAGARDAYLRATVVDEKSLAAWDGLCSAETELAMTHWIAAIAGRSTLERDHATSIGASASTSCGHWSELARGVPDGAKKVSSDLRPVRAAAAQNDAPGVRVYLPMHPGNAIVEALAYLADVPNGDEKAHAAAIKNAQPALARADISKLEAPADLALVAYSAGAAGNAARSQQALSELAKRAPRHVLLETLRGLSISATDAGVLDAAVTADAGADAKAATVAVGGGGGGAAAGGGGGGDTPGGDYRALNEKGHKALASGDVSKAETYFKAALAQHPGDVDALYGLGQIARSRGEHAAAITYFQQVLNTSAGFAPARLALADEQWATGDKASATKNYELYLERVSEGSGADRARQRLGKETNTKIEPKQDPAPKPEGKE